MKKYLFAMLAMIVAISAGAQVRTSRTFAKQKSRTEYILRAGLSLNKLSGLEDSYSSSGIKIKAGSKAGFAVDLDFNKYFGASNGYWGMGIGIGTRGVSSDESGVEAGFSAYNVKLTALTLGYKYAVTEAIRIDPHFNIYGAYDFSVSGTGDIKDMDCGFDGKFDVGIQPGIGIWYDRFNFDISYMLGFIAAEPYADSAYFDGGKTRNLVLRLGVRF